jgi:hypothetical protein
MTKLNMLNAIPSLILILLLLVYLFKRGSSNGAVIAIFVYASLHGGYLIFVAANAENAGQTMIDLHQNHTMSFAVIGACFLSFCCIAMLLRLDNPIEKARSHSTVIAGSALVLTLFFIAMTVGAMNHAGCVFIPMPIEKEVVSSVMMWLLAMLVALTVASSNDGFGGYKNEIIVLTSLLLLVMPALGFYEIDTGMVWARTVDAQRSSASLFNPNVLGLWVSLMVLLISFMFHLGWLSKRLTGLFMMLLVASLILSGSRSGLLLCMMNLLGITSMLLISRNVKQASAAEKLWPMMTFLFLIVAATVILELLKPIENPMVTVLQANSERFVQLPLELFRIVLHSPLTADSMESLDGRVQLGVFADNSFLSIYAIGGFSALVFWLLLWSTMAWLAINKYRAFPGIYSIYALTATMSCLISGLFLRSAQLFPVWVFISIVLGLNLGWWLFGVDDAKVSEALEIQTVR